jgi:hypothetical protein
METKWLMVLGAACALASTACEKKQEATPDPASEEGSAQASAPPVKETPKGLEDPGNDAGVVEITKAALECEWTSGQPMRACADYVAWRKDPSVRKGKADATFVNLLSDSNPKVRWLGAEGLKSNGKAYRADAQMAEAVLAAAAAEADKNVAHVMGVAVARIDGAKSGTNAAIQELITTHPLTELRAAAIKDYLFMNKEPENYAFVVGLLEGESDGDIRLAALKSIWVGTPRDRIAQTCALWLKSASDADTEVAGQAAYYTAFYRRGGGCASQWGPLLDLLEARAEQGGFASSTMSSALRTMHNQKTASPEQRARALAIAREVVSNPKNDSAARHSALRFIGETDPGAKKFAGKFEDDPEPFVKATAKDILGGMITLKKGK